MSKPYKIHLFKPGMKLPEIDEVVVLHFKTGTPPQYGHRDVSEIFPDQWYWKTPTDIYPSDFYAIEGWSYEIETEHESNLRNFCSKNRNLCLEYAYFRKMRGLQKRIRTLLYISRQEKNNITKKFTKEINIDKDTLQPVSSIDFIDGRVVYEILSNNTVKPICYRPKRIKSNDPSLKILEFYELITDKLLLKVVIDDSSKPGEVVYTDYFQPGVDWLFVSKIS